MADLIFESLKDAGLNAKRVPTGGITWDGMGSGITVGGPDRELVAGLKDALEKETNCYVSISNPSEKQGRINYIEMGTRPFVKRSPNAGPENAP
jgi:hypothetical protein